MLNYHHLRYFQAVARDGNLTRASGDLGKTPQTISHQIRTLENELGTPLFHRRGRRLILTEAGEKVLSYAEEIFSLGQELVDSVEAQSGERPVRLTVGVADVLPKRLAHTLILPALGPGKEIRLICREAAPERLLAELALGEVDLVLSDAPIPPSVSVRAHGHLLGKGKVCIMASPPLAKLIEPGFPSSLTGRPLLVPTDRSALRREIDRWIEDHHLHPRVAGEFDDFALMGTFAQAGFGVIPVPAAIAGEVGEEMGIQMVGMLDGVLVQFYAITLEDHGEDEAIAAILGQQHPNLFQ
jgi:LysR family transcriptional activator of nhaA